MTKVRTTIAHGWLGFLYRKCSAYTDDPTSEIERLANQALADGVIDDRQYTILQHRIPFSGVERKSQEKVGSMFEVTGQRIRWSEKQIYVAFDRNYV